MSLNDAQLVETRWNFRPRFPVNPKFSIASQVEIPFFRLKSFDIDKKHMLVIKKSLEESFK